MQRSPWRQVLLAGLVVLILGTAIRTLWLGARPAPGGQPPPPPEPTGPLAGLIILVDPGHGGMDPGAVVQQTREKELTLQVGLLLKEQLEGRGAKVILTRTADEHPARTIREELGRRVAMIQEHGGNLFISIHANKDSCNCWGAQTFYQKKGLPDGKLLALAIQAQLRATTPTTRHALPADFYVLRNASVPSALVELGFLTNADEHARLLQPEYQKSLALAIAAGIEEYQRLKKEGVELQNPADPPNPKGSD